MSSKLRLDQQLPQPRELGIRAQRGSGADPQRDDSRHYAYSRPTASRLEHIRDVVEKISAMDLKPSWSVKPAALTLEFSDGGVPVQLKSPSGSGMGFLKFGAESYAVRFSPVNFVRDKNDFVGFARKVFYGHFISALEDGTFSYLGRCSECERFFATKRLGVKYCAKKCMTRADAKKATLRVRNLRLQLRRQQQTKMENAIDRKRFARFEEFLALVARNHHKIEDWTKCARYLGNSERRTKGWVENRAEMGAANSRRRFFGDTLVKSNYDC